MSLIVLLLVSSVIGDPDYVLAPSVSPPARNTDAELVILVRTCDILHERLIHLDHSTLRDESVRLQMNSVSKFEACFDQFAMIQTEALRLVCLAFGVAYQYMVDTRKGTKRDILDLNVPSRWHGPDGGELGVMVNDLDELVGEIRAFRDQLDALDETRRRFKSNNSSIAKRIRLGVIREGELFDKAMKCLKSNNALRVFPDPFSTDLVIPERVSQLLTHYDSRLHSIALLREEGWNLNTMSVDNMRTELTATLSWIKTNYGMALIDYNTEVSRVRTAHEQTIPTIARLTTDIEYVKIYRPCENLIDSLLNFYAGIEVFLRYTIADQVTKPRLNELVGRGKALRDINDFGVLTIYKFPLMRFYDEAIKLETSLMTIKDNLADKKAQSVSLLTMWRAALLAREAEGPAIWTLADIVTECLDDETNNFDNIDFELMINRLA
jgi:hypothetical protein